MTEKIMIGVSSCLLGKPVRYDGGHKHNRYITDILGNYFEFTPVCPEVECGLPVPRETMRLLGNPENPRLITSKTGIDHTDQMLSFCEAKVKELRTKKLCGFIFKKNSPSSGLYRVKVYGNKGQAQKTGRGLFAAAFVKSFPLLPVEEEGRLQDAPIRENFIEKVFCYHRWMQFTAAAPNYRKLINYHAHHKLQLMAHSPKQLSMMGKLAANGKAIEPGMLMENYQIQLMVALSLKATVKKNVNVLFHIIGYFKKLNSPDEQAELIELIENYARHLVPLIVPLTLINHFVRKYNIPYLAGQTYLEPHPAELMLRHHV
jgi:uncharacterized protein YbgA (DUF1722 family)/uncharacterized protein YbbK (DUF523 family)